jgi:hypothetical protein
MCSLTHLALRRANNMSMNNSKLRGISKGFAANKLLRKRINEAIYATSVVVNKIELSYNKETKEFENY